MSNFLITYSFPNVNGENLNVYQWESKTIPHFTGHVVYPAILLFIMLIETFLDGDSQSG